MWGSKNFPEASPALIGRILRCLSGVPLVHVHTLYNPLPLRTGRLLIWLDIVSVIISLHSRFLSIGLLSEPRQHNVNTHLMLKEIKFQLEGWKWNELASPSNEESCSELPLGCLDHWTSSKKMSVLCLSSWAWSYQKWKVKAAGWVGDCWLSVGSSKPLLKLCVSRQDLHFSVPPFPCLQSRNNYTILLWGYKKWDILFLHVSILLR